MSQGLRCPAVCAGWLKTTEKQVTDHVSISDTHTPDKMCLPSETLKESADLACPAEGGKSSSSLWNRCAVTSRWSAPVSALWTYGFPSQPQSCPGKSLTHFHISQYEAKISLFHCPYHPSSKECNKSFLGLS